MTKQHSLNNNDVREIAGRLTERLLARQLGAEGATLQLEIAAHVAQVDPIWQRYADLIEGVDIDLNLVKSMFAPEAWAKLSNNKRVLLTAEVQKCAVEINKSIEANRRYFQTMLVFMQQALPENVAVLEYQLAKKLGHDVTPEDFKPKAQ
ncbi:hypothetical protein [Hymenobacter glacieicola]|uniref:Uncharacterized protein n=1 Tax=Hymenobacter glacieicola TaxID=1562124 RepID=A0ABQ1X5D1_9BACT|nr:hypothetical protein [Hymenobacter glacieicola]GGG60778.1 hypothetical protein GCM10011378_41010 [Hymenobacter glacieicola]